MNEINVDFSGIIDFFKNISIFQVFIFYLIFSYLLGIKMTRGWLKADPDVINGQIVDSYALTVFIYIVAFLISPFTVPFWIIWKIISVGIITK